MTLIDLPGSAWLRIARCLNPEQLADVIKVSRGVRATLLRHMPYPPRLEVELGGDRLTSAAIIQARAEECPQVHLCLRAAYEQSKEEATACAMQLLEAVGPSGRAVVCLTLRVCSTVQHSAHVRPTAVAWWQQCQPCAPLHRLQLCSLTAAHQGSHGLAKGACLRPCKATSLRRVLLPAFRADACVLLLVCCRAWR